MKKHRKGQDIKKLFIKTNTGALAYAVHSRKASGGDYSLILPFGRLAPQKDIHRFFKQVYKMRGKLFTMKGIFPQKAVLMGGCWLWQGKLDGKGYGDFWWRGRYIKAHRFANLLFRGPIHNESKEVFDEESNRKRKRRVMELHHSCERRNCVNPAHLELMIKAENLFLRGGILNKDGSIKVYQEKPDTLAAAKATAGPVTIGPVGSIADV